MYLSVPLKGTFIIIVIAAQVSLTHIVKDVQCADA